MQYTTNVLAAKKKAAAMVVVSSGSDINTAYMYQSQQQQPTA